MNEKSLKLIELFLQLNEDNQDLAIKFVKDVIFESREEIESIQ